MTNKIHTHIYIIFYFATKVTSDQRITQFGEKIEIRGKNRETAGWNLSTNTELPVYRGAGLTAGSFRAETACLRAETYRRATVRISLADWIPCCPLPSLCARVSANDTRTN